MSRTHVVIRGAGWLAWGFLMACASTRQGPEPDRQTHWMEACDSDVDCGELSCLCGVCTLACEGQGDCDGRFDDPSACMLASAPIASRLCRFSSEGSVCIPKCEQGGDCDRSVSQAPSVPEGPPAALYCEDLYRGNATEGVQVLASGPMVDFYAIAGRVYWATLEGIMQARPDGSNASLAVRLPSQLSSLAADQNGLVWSESDVDVVRLRELPRGQSEPIELARLEGPDANPGAAIALDDDAVYWLSGGNVLRSPRVPGRTAWLVEGQEWFLPQTLALSPSHVYYVSMAEPDQLSVHRVAVSGTGADEEVARGQYFGITITADHVYYGDASRALSEGQLGQPGGIWRNPLDGVRPELVATTMGEPFGLSSDDDNLYWVELETQPPDARLGSSLWRMPIRGGQAPSPVLLGDVLVTKVMVSPARDGFVYAMGACYFTDPDRQFEYFLVRIRTP